MENVGIGIFVAFGAGILSFLSPCVLPLFPSYLSYITGMSLGEVKYRGARRSQRWTILIHSLLFVFGFSLIFILMGASFSFLGRALAAHKVVVQRVGGAIIIFFGLLVADWLRIPLLMRYIQPSSKSISGYLGAFLVGISLAAGWTPCVGPVLGSILTLSAVGGDPYKGMLLLGAYSAGLGLPFILSALLIQFFFTFFDALKKYIPVVQKTGGIILIAIGLLLVTDTFSTFGAVITRLFSG